jgi:hypothetical protein
MGTVRSVCEIQNSVGALGFSALKASYDGVVTRMTVLYLRDGKGSVLKTIIAPAATVKELL